MLKLIWGVCFSLTCFSFTGLVQMADRLAHTVTDPATDAYCHSIAHAAIARELLLRCGAVWSFEAERWVVDASAMVFGAASRGAGLAEVARAVDALMIAACAIVIAIACAAGLATRFTRSVRIVVLLVRALFFAAPPPLEGNGGRR
jgi:hypothetical protein